MVIAYPEEVLYSGAFEVERVTLVIALKQFC